MLQNVATPKDKHTADSLRSPKMITDDFTYTKCISYATFIDLNMGKPKTNNAEIMELGTVFDNIRVPKCFYPKFCLTLFCRIFLLPVSIPVISPRFKRHAAPLLNVEDPVGFPSPSHRVPLGCRGHH